VRLDQILNREKKKSYFQYYVDIEFFQSFFPVFERASDFL